MHPTEAVVEQARKRSKLSRLQCKLDDTVQASPNLWEYSIDSVLLLLSWLSSADIKATVFYLAFSLVTEERDAQGTSPSEVEVVILLGLLVFVNLHSSKVSFCISGGKRWKTPSLRDGEGGRVRYIKKNIENIIETLYLFHVCGHR